MKFLTEHTHVNYTINKASEFINIQKYLLDDFELINAYYKHREGIVNNKNIIVRLIKQIIPDMTKDMTEILNLISIDYKYKAKFLGLTSNLSKGKVFTDIFGETCSILVNSFVNPFEAYEDLDLPVCKVLFTDYTDLSMNHPSKIKKNNFILMLDIEALIMQYKKWTEIRKNEMQPTSVQVFVYQVFYTNLIREILDWSMLNRFFNPLVEDSKSLHPFGVRNYDSSINKMMSSLNLKLVNTNRFYEEVLCHIPSLFYENIYEKLKYDKYLVNAQNYWLYFITLSSLLNRLINLLGREGYKKNNDLIVDFKYVLRDVKHNNYLNYIDYKTIEFTDYVFGLFDEASILTGETR